MKFNIAFIRSKVARRVVWMFFISSLLPIAAIAFFSSTYVTDLLTQQSYRHLQNASKLYGMAVLDRLLSVDNKLRKLSLTLHTTAISQPGPTASLNTQHLLDEMLEMNESQLNKLALERISITSLGPVQYDSSGQSKSYIYSKEDQAGDSNIYLRRIVAKENNNTVVTLVAELDKDFVWGKQNSLPFTTNPCVIERTGKVLFCPLRQRQTLLASINKATTKLEPSKLTWMNGDEKNLAVAWDLFIKSNFSGTDWKIISSQREADALLPVYAYQEIFPMVIAFSVLVVLLLSLIQIRRIMLPLDGLVKATRRLAKYEFGAPVAVNTKDEFRELGESFNTMAYRLEKQFNALKILSEIDHLILTCPDPEVVLANILETAHKIIVCDFIAVALVNKSDKASGKMYIKEVIADKLPYIEAIEIPALEAATLLNQPDDRLIDLEKQPWRILEPLTRQAVVAAQVIPILRDGEIRAIFCLGYRTQGISMPEDGGILRDLIDRLAVTLATADRDEKLYRQAHFDFLTGLPNRQLFNDRLEQHIIQARRKNERAAVLYIDLDRFKNINDSLGHASGDKLLCQVAERMKTCVRETDTVSRLGGDEFVILLANVIKPKDVGYVAAHIIAEISKPYMISSREIFISTSIGIAIYPDDGEDNKELLAHADAAMYHAKENGRGRYQYFEESMNKELIRRIEMEAAMRHALQRGEYRLYYQPQIDLRSGRVTAIEALIRWDHPQLGLISPARFIPLAEECGLIEPLGEWVLRTACNEFRQWRDTHFMQAKLAVNISIRQFMRENFVDIVEQTIMDADISPQELELEITESLLLDESVNTKLILEKLSALGIKLAIDDFGTGYSSLSYLKRFAVHTLKIDRAFTKDIPDDEQATTLTLSIIAMAHALNMQVVAEGVENVAQLELLREHQCDSVQGYYFGRPEPIDKVVSHLDQLAKNAALNESP